MINDTPEIIDEYARYMAVIRNRALGTITEYVNDLTMFFRFVLASRQKLSTDDEGLHAIDLSGLDLDTVGSVTTAEVYEFLFYAKNQRHNEARALAPSSLLLRAITNTSPPRYISWITTLP